MDCKFKNCIPYQNIYLKVFRFLYSGIFEFKASECEKQFNGSVEVFFVIFKPKPGFLGIYIFEETEVRF